MTNKVILAFTSATIVIVVGLIDHSQVAARIVSIAPREEKGIPHKPPFDIPEEVLRTQIIIEARSPIDGKALTAAQYAELQAQIKSRRYPPKLNTKVRQSVFLLRLRSILLKIFPFLDI